MAHIRVAGTGGLGLVAAILIIALYLPELRYALSIGVGLGAAFGGLLILARARTRAGAPGDRGPRANAMLPLDDRTTVARAAIDADRPGREQAFAVA
jgi:hypothetical protein